MTNIFKTAFFVFFCILLVGDVGATQFETIESTRRGRSNLHLPADLLPSLRKLAITLYMEGDPQSANVRTNPFETDPVEITFFIRRLEMKYSLPDSTWSDLIDEFYYSDPAGDRLYNWTNFDGHVERRAITRMDRAAISATKKGLKEWFLVDDQAIQQLVDGFITEEGLYRPGVRDQYRQDFPGFAVDSLLDRDEFESLISDESRMRLELLRYPMATKTPPTVGPWGDEYEELDCSFYAVLNRMFEWDPSFHLKWNYHFKTPLVFLDMLGAPLGKTGGGGNVVRQRTLILGVETVRELCRKEQARRLALRPGPVHRPVTPDVQLDANGIWPINGHAIRISHGKRSIRGVFTESIGKITAGLTLFETTLDGLSFRAQIPASDYFVICDVVLEGKFSPEGNTMTARWFYPNLCNGRRGKYYHDSGTLYRISR